MSLINDMLKNLDRRQQRGDIAADLPPTQAHRQPRKFGPAAAVAAALAVGLAAFAVERMWPRGTPEDPSRTTIAEVELPQEGVEPQATAEPEPVVEQVTVSEPETPEAAETDLVETDSVETGLVETEVIDTDLAETEPVEPEPVEPEPAEQEPVRDTVERTLRATTPRERADEAYASAVRHLSAGRRAQAEDALEDALGHYGAHHDARSALVNLLLGAGRSREAELLLQEGLRISPKHAPFADRYARLLMRRGDLAAALGVLEDAAPPIEEDPEYHALAAYLHQQADNHPKAAGLYRELVAIRPGQGSWWMGLGLSLEALDNPEQALDAYRRARGDARLGGEVLRFINGRIRVLGGGDGTDD